MDSLEYKLIKKQQRKERVKRIIVWVSVGVVIVLSLTIALIAAFGLFSLPFKKW
ncbi:hypothetical protein [Metamycoplasma buccale]|uniref:hypothetical protein n=1 Tax=Metamycoplasma buccale TaxID=55602 RepID=UPI00398F67D0